MWRFDFNSLQVTRLTIPFLVMLGMLQRIATLARRYNTHTTIGRFRNILIWKLLHLLCHETQTGRNGRIGKSC
jgi:hypothetical protein